MAAPPVPVPAGSVILVDCEGAAARLRLAAAGSRCVHRRRLSCLRRHAWPGLSWSGWRDSNSRPPAPKAGALTKLRYIPFWPAEAYPLPARSAGAGSCVPARQRDRAGKFSRDAEPPGGPVCCRRRREPSRGRSSMVEPQPSKLVMRFRLPSPAPRRTCRLRRHLPERARPAGHPIRCAGHVRATC